MKVTRAECLAWRKIDQETVVIHLAERKMFGLNDIGGRMWEALSAPTTLERLEAIVVEGGLEGANVIDAVERFIVDLAEEGLVMSDEPLEGRGDDAEVVDFMAPGVSGRVPRIEWREEIRQFAGQCHFLSGQSHQCNQHPGGS
ncbi:MAG: PqqD family protein [Thermoanaerobaculales bacterium]|nr:PqqD family protein [Thermoanaerobaculales bacterium]